HHISTTKPTPYSHTLSLYDALPISADAAGQRQRRSGRGRRRDHHRERPARHVYRVPVAVEHLEDEVQILPDEQAPGAADVLILRSEEHTSELQSRENLVCRLLLEKK